MRGSGLVCDSGEGGGRRSEFWNPDALVESIWFKMLEPSKGAPMNSSDVFSLNDRVGFENRFPPLCPGGALNSEPARIGDGPLGTWRSSEELDDAYAAGFGEVPVRTCPELLFDLG
jgi:hypothetical protein